MVYNYRYANLTKDNLSNPAHTIPLTPGCKTLFIEKVKQSLTNSFNFPILQRCWKKATPTIDNSEVCMGFQSFKSEVAVFPLHLLNITLSSQHHV